MKNYEIFFDVVDSICKFKLIEDGILNAIKCQKMKQVEIAITNNDDKKCKFFPANYFKKMIEKNKRYCDLYKTNTLNNG